MNPRYPRSQDHGESTQDPYRELIRSMVVIALRDAIGNGKRLGNESRKVEQQKSLQFFKSETGREFLGALGLLPEDIFKALEDPERVDRLINARYKRKV